jgi:GGDEF domain-containing protein
MPFRRWSFLNPTVQRDLDVPLFREAYPQLTAELRRARRYEHALALVMISATPQASRAHKSFIPAASRVVDTPSAHLRLGVFLRSVLREFDILVGSPADRCYAVLMPETDKEHAHQATTRFRSEFLKQAEIDLRVGCAVFPSDALAVDELFRRARSDWQQQQRAGEIGMPPTERSSLAG